MSKLNTYRWSAYGVTAEMKRLKQTEPVLLATYEMQACSLSTVKRERKRMVKHNPSITALSRTKKVA